MGGGKGNWFKSYTCSQGPSLKWRIRHTATGRGVASIQKKTLEWKQGHGKGSGRENPNWVVEKETGEEAEELPEDRGGWVEARRTYS